MDNWGIAREEKTSFTKRHRLREGKRGRPRKTKPVAMERTMRGPPSGEWYDDGIHNTDESQEVDWHLLETSSSLVGTQIEEDEPFDERVDNDDFE